MERVFLVKLSADESGDAISAKAADRQSVLAARLDGMSGFRVAQYLVATMKFVLLTHEPELMAAAQAGFHPSDSFEAFESADEALEACAGADLLFVDLLATLDEPHKISGYERFAERKMEHEAAKTVPLVLIAPPDDYELDFMAGWPDFVFAHIRRPVTEKIFRRASTWV